MSESTLNTPDRIEQLMEALQFTACDAESAIGELAGIPTTFTVLGGDPLALLFQFRIHPDESDPPQIKELIAEIPDNDVSCSVEGKFLWLSLYRLDETSTDQVVHLVRSIADRIQDSSFRVVAGCLKCGKTDGACLRYADGHPSRVCDECLNEASIEQRNTYQNLNRSSVLATVRLPLTAVGLAVAWAVFWTIIAMALEFWQIEVIEINIFTVLMLVGAGAGLSWLLGWPAGRVMRRSAAIQRSPKMKIAWFLLVTCLCGEILVLAIQIARFLGVFDLVLAAQLLGDFFASYTRFWVSCKVGLIGGLYLFCYTSATLREEVELDL